MKTKKIKWNLTIPVVLLVVAALLIASTLALFTETSSGTRTFTLSNFTSSVSVTFERNNVLTLTPTKTALGDSIYVSASVNPNDANYIGDLHVSLTYTGAGVGLIRVHISEEWSTTSAGGVKTVYPYKTQVPYKVANPYGATDTGNQTKWYDNRGTDLCFYYATPVKSSSGQQINLITGVDTDDMDFQTIAAQDLKIIIKADVVQVNRYPQYWGITALPWTGASSLTETAI